MARLKRWIAAGIGAAVIAVIATYETIPNRNTDRIHFDTLIVLGVPANLDGTASPEERSRVGEALREFRMGRAQHLILSGGAAHNQWVEGEVMAREAQSQGVPAAAIEVEGHSQNTIQNIFYSRQIMQQHGWQSAEVVSSPSHLPRTRLILERYNFPWTTHAAPWPQQYSRLRIAAIYLYESVGTTKYRWFGLPSSSFLPARP